MNVVWRVFRASDQAALDRAWSLIPQLPFDGSVDVQDQQSSDSVPLDVPFARAQAHLSAVSRHIFSDCDGEIGVIRIGDGLFELADEHQRAAVLLHELIHLRLYSGRLRANSTAMEATRRDIPQGREAHYDLADQLGKCVQEIACDRYAALPQYESLRASYFDGERRAFYRSPNAYLQYQGDDVDTPELRPYLAVYRLIRAEAGLGVYNHDPAMLTELQDLQQRYRDELRRACGSDSTLYEALRHNCDHIVNVRVDVNEPDERNYMELFDMTMSLEHPRAEKGGA